jgi:hypothetical protein
MPEARNMVVPGHGPQNTVLRSTTAVNVTNVTLAAPQGRRTGSAV